MIIKALILENFKGIREPVRIEFKPITLLFGPNSAGKSTILQALVYAREIFERHNLDPDRTLLGGDWLDLGGFSNLIHMHDLSKTLRIGFELDLRNHGLNTYFTETDAELLEQRVLDQSEYGNATYPENLLSSIDTMEVFWGVRWSELRNEPYVESLAIAANSVQLAEVRSSSDGKDIAIDVFNICHPIFKQKLELKEENKSLLVNGWFYELCKGEISHKNMLINPKYEISQEKFINSLPASLDKDLLDCLPVPDYPDTELSEYYSRLSISDQKDALPKTGSPLSLDESVWAQRDEIDWPYESNIFVFQNYIRAIFTGVIVGPIELLQGELEKLIYIGPLREVAPRNLSHIRSPDPGRWSNGTAAWEVLTNAEETFLEKVNEWIAAKDRLNTGYQVKQHRFRELPVDHPISYAIAQDRVLDEDGLANALESIPTKSRVSLIELQNDLEVAPRDIGVGVSQVLPVVVAVLHHRSGILAIEQPELHIHPALQVALGDLFIQDMDEKDTIYLLETHSEHLMLRFLRRIRETTECKLPPGAPALIPDQVSVIYVQNTEQGVKLKPLPVSEEGEFLERWPEGFFEERDYELFGDLEWFTNTL